MYSDLTVQRHFQRANYKPMKSLLCSFLCSLIQLFNLVMQAFQTGLFFPDIQSGQPSKQRFAVSGFKSYTTYAGAALVSCPTVIHSPTCRLIPWTLFPIFPQPVSPLSVSCSACWLPTQPTSEPINHLSGSRLKLGLFTHLITNRS